MKTKIKRIEGNTFKIMDCEDETYIGKKIIIDRIKDFNKCIVSGWYEIDTAGNIWSYECNKLIGVYEIVGGSIED